MQASEFQLHAADGHRWTLLARIPESPVASLLWLPALGIAARHYLPLTDVLAARGIAVFVHEWRGNGSSHLRASHECDWGYRELLVDDLPVSEAAVDKHLPNVPRIIGGHSLGGQLACCRLALQPGLARRLWLVGSGSPYWRAFPLPLRLCLPLVYRFAPWLADRCGALPGRRIGFGGQEARGLIHDWARSALSGHYSATGMTVNLEAAMAQVEVDVRCVVLDDDWLAPETSLRFLLSKLPHSQAAVDILDSNALGVRADHFSWMKQPEAVVRMLVG